MKFFKVLDGCDLYAKLRVLDSKITAARTEIQRVLTSKGFSGKFACGHSDDDLVSCDAIEIDQPCPPDGWKRMGKDYQRLYYPKVSNRKEYKEISALPNIRGKELNELTNFNFHVDGNLAIHHRLGIVFGGDYILLHTFSGQYIPVEGMIEITGSEFAELKDHLIK